MNSAADKTQKPTPSGILLVDKPAGFTSHDVVARTRRLAQTRKVGHAGTLDPMATGLLILGINSSTRLLTYLVGLDKEYLATIRLGASTTTDDREGELVERAAAGAVEALDDESIDRALDAQRGIIEQIPSSVSAIKVDGQRAYARVRAGEDVVLKSRTVTIDELEVLGGGRAGVDDEGHPVLDVDVRVVCSSGTYVRAIARDLGAALGVGGHLTSLRRSRVGPFQVADAPPLDQLQALVEAGEPLPLRAPADVARSLFPVLDVDAAETAALGHGQRIRVTDELPDGPVAAITAAGRLVGLVQREKTKAKSIVNFPPDEYEGEHQHETENEGPA
ncbi:tRNA pseudouridine(55) synthase TruB [Herbiconiux sp. CPCC 205716]|uniref:tRNA pseudouridine synthase B n=1 Tax=Herbiconiux gentiana TaxID=2970912 RepID=A0ABT2GFN0_9MICO|nr:tRNA pseudouridine(55) synthase TruB [Herbiconiux gentiana]MCS5715034.1 tRNA pseudouridine(55) synthase TruB [Herbiconiux gentiana]